MHVCVVLLLPHPPNHSTSVPGAFVNLLRIGEIWDLDLSGFFVAEGKPGIITDDIPQVIAEMHARAKLLKYGAIHITNELYLLKSHRQIVFQGALTDGFQWVFVILYLNNDGSGATYRYSGIIDVYYKFPQLGHGFPGEHGPDVIAGMVLYWVC